MAIGAVGAVTSGMVQPPQASARTGQQGQTQQQLGTPAQSQQQGCTGHHPPYAQGMSTETFMALKNQPTGPESTMDGIKKVLEMAALLKILETIQKM